MGRVILVLSAVGLTAWGIVPHPLKLNREAAVVVAASWAAVQEPEARPGDGVVRDAPTAEIEAVAQKVEQRPFPDPWTTARAGNRLKARDGVRTYRNSSAELAFEDASRLVVGEQSLVFLREVSTKRVEVGRNELEIVEGQADVESRPALALRSDIEVLVGGTRTRVRATAEEGGKARARKTAAGAAQVMIFGGEADVESAGGRVKLERGMGTSVLQGRAPEPPEQLLSAPEALAPEEGRVLDYANPSFGWGPVPAAASYTLEVCADATCSRLVMRRTGLTDRRWQPDGLPIGEHFWRVSAVSRSGLDGFASRATRFSIGSLWRRPAERPGRS